MRDRLSEQRAEHSRGAPGVTLLVGGDEPPHPTLVHPRGARTREAVWQAVDLDLTDANYDVFTSKGASYTQHIPLKGEPRFLKIIAYDYAADAIGTSTIAITTPAK